MRQTLFFIFFVLLISNGRSQSSSLDSLRLVLPIGHTSSITKIIVSKDSKYIATGNLGWAYWGSNFDEPSDQNVIIWNRNGVPLHSIKLEIPPTHLSDFSFDNRYIITGGHSFKIWDVFKGELIKELNIKGSIDCSDPINFLPGSYDIYYKNENSIRRIKFRDNSFEEISDEALMKVGYDKVKFYRTSNELIIFLNDTVSFIWNGLDFNKSINSDISNMNTRILPNDKKDYFKWMHPMNEFNMDSVELIEHVQMLKAQGIIFEHINKSKEKLFFDFTDSPITPFGGKEWGTFDLNTGRKKIFKNKTTIIDFFDFLNPTVLYYESNGHYVSIDFYKMIIKHRFISEFNEWSHFFWSDGKIVVKNFGRPLVFDLENDIELKIIQPEPPFGESAPPFGLDCGGKGNCIDTVIFYNDLYHVVSFDSIYSYQIIDSNFICINIASVETFSSIFDHEPIEIPYKIEEKNELNRDSGINLILSNINDESKIVLKLNNSNNRGGQYLRNHEPFRFLFHREASLLIINETDRLHFFDTNGKSLFNFIPIDDINFILLLDNGYYYLSNRNIVKNLHYYESNDKVIGFDQLDPVYNRPDIVLDSIGKYFGGADQELVARYREAWEKRIDRLGLDKEKLGKGEISVPNAEFVGAEDIAYENTSGQLELKVEANDPKYTLRRFNILVNEVPLYGSEGISIASRGLMEWDTTIAVPLGVGENKIQVSVMNELGLENFKYPTYVNYKPSAKNEVVAKTYFIGIGVDEFEEAGHNLNYCVKDIEDLSNAFESSKNTESIVLTNEKVTKENILALKNTLKNTSVHDKVIISCSSHGLLDDENRFYLATHDVDFSHPEHKGLPYAELEGLLDSIPARQKLLMLDACNSGENEIEQSKRPIAKTTNTNDENQGKTRGEILVEAEEEFQSSFETMMELFVNVSNETGSVIISAAGGKQSALEGEAVKINGKKIENGAFTYSVLEYLKQTDETLTVNGLKSYVEKRVEEITGGKQRPTSRQETMEVDWELR